MQIIDETRKSKFYLEVGDKVSFSKTVGETDIYLFAGITGDFAPVHTNEHFMRHSSYGHRIAHGILIVGFMSTASSMIVAGGPTSNSDQVPVSLGYDRIRFLKPVFIGDTITIHYEIKEVDAERGRTKAAVSAINQHGETVAVAEHILKWVKENNEGVAAIGV